MRRKVCCCRRMVRKALFCCQHACAASLGCSTQVHIVAVPSRATKAYFQLQELPRVNPIRKMEFAGAVQGFSGEAVQR